MKKATTVKKLLAICLAMTVLVIAAPIQSIAASAYDETSYTLTGDVRNDLVGIAKTQIGYCEGKNAKQLDGTIAGHNNYTKYASYSQMNGEPWCAMFVVWCARHAGITSASGILDTTVRAAATPGDSSSYSFHISIYSANIYTPQPGDLIFFNTDSTHTTNPATRSTWNGTNNVYAHVGIVEKVVGTTVYTIEGNVSDKVISNSYDLSDSSIMGYGIPTGFSMPTNLVIPTITLNGSSFTAGENITVSFTGSQNTKDWIGINQNASVPGSSIIWYYLNGSQTPPTSIQPDGSLTIQTSSLSPGTYYIYYCVNDGYEYYARQSFTITS